VDHFSAYQHIERRINNNCSGARQKSMRLMLAAPGKQSKCQPKKKDRRWNGIRKNTSVAKTVTSYVVSKDFEYLSRRD
jgi:hypothetical protein